MVRAINEHPDADIFYSDKDCIDESGKHRLRPLFKAKWSPDIMWAANYLTHFTVMRTDLVRSVGGWRTETDGAQDWDIFLRVVDSGAQIEFVPGVLYHWRLIASSVSSGGLNAKPYAAQAQIRTVEDHGQRRGVSISAVAEDQGPIKIQWNTAREHSVTLILVPPDGEVASINAWAATLDSRTDWRNLQIVAPVVDYSGTLGRISFVSVDREESLAKRLNRAVHESTSDYLVFLDQSVRIDEPAWLNEIVGPLTDPEIAAVGAKLVDNSNITLRHAGIVFNNDGSPDYIFSGQPEWVSNEFGAAIWYRNWSAVSGACFAVKRSAFEKAGRFSEQPDYPRHDIDLCLRIGLNHGNRVLYNPFAKFVQTRESLLERWLTPNAQDVGASYIRESLTGGDPFFHRQLESRNGQLLFAPRPSGIATQDYSAESRALIQAYDASPELIRQSKSGTASPGANSIQRLTWVLPVFQHAFYGGVMTILRFADYFRRAHGVKSDFVFLGGAPEEVMRVRLASAFPELAESSGITRLRSYSDWDRVEPSDGTISTLWTTAYAALHFKRTRRKFYFVQDYESLFYPAGSTYALAEATYRFGYHGICNTRSLAGMYREFGGDAEYFDPCIDSNYFFEKNRTYDETKPQTVFCYARPGHPRNCFELLTQALRLLKNRMGDGVRIFSAGAEWNPSDYGLEGVVENLGLLGYSATGALYRTCDIGVVMMMTRHPSYLPMELMACGALVVTNENRYTRWLLENEKNCLLSETSPGALAEVMERGLRDNDLRARITKHAAGQVLSQYSDWDGQTEKIYQYIVRMNTSSNLPMLDSEFPTRAQFLNAIGKTLHGTGVEFGAGADPSRLVPIVKCCMRIEIRQMNLKPADILVRATSLIPIF